MRRRAKVNLKGGFPSGFDAAWRKPPKAIGFPATGRRHAGTARAPRHRHVGRLPQEATVSFVGPDRGAKLIEQLDLIHDPDAMRGAEGG